MRPAANIHLGPQTVVFRRWSRKRYAVFAGLHKNIVVGVLKTDICDAALLKTEGVIRQEQAEAMQRRNNRPDESSIGQHILLSIGEAVPSNNTQESAGFSFRT